MATHHEQQSFVNLKSNTYEKTQYKYTTFQVNSKFQSRIGR